MTSLARAQSADPQDLRNFEPPSTDPYGALFSEATGGVGAGNFHGGLWFSYARDLILLRDASDEVVATPIENQYSLDFVAGYGLTDDVTLGLALPAVLHQNGEGSELLDADGVSGSALGDLRIDLKATAFSPARLAGGGVAVLGRLTLPTGGTRGFVHHENPTGEMRVLGELKLFLLSLRGTAGLRARDEVSVLGESLGADLPWALAAGFTPSVPTFLKTTRWDFGAELRGRLGISDGFGREVASPTLFGLFARYTAGDYSAMAAAETSLNGGIGGPAARAVLALGYAPRFRDHDQDGLEDALDQCPELAEDHDGFQDFDGCPEFDNDQDGVTDPDDRCGAEKEDLDGFDDADGCPDPDNDQDGILDDADTCPREQGSPSRVEKWHGCPARDSDGDGIFDDVDRCIERPEDKDGYDDADGCPDLDNDGDGVFDVTDACPDEAGPSSFDDGVRGCPTRDADGDTYRDDADQCPNEAEDFDGNQDDDGCPELAAAGVLERPLVTVAETPAGPTLRINRPLAFVDKSDGEDFTPETRATLRAVAAELNRRPEFAALVGVRPSNVTPEAKQVALARTFMVVLELRRLTRRDDVIATTDWEAVKNEPGAWAAGAGIKLIQRPPAASERKRRRDRNPRGATGPNAPAPTRAEPPAPTGDPQP